MKKLIIIPLILICHMISNAQGVAVNASNTPPAPSAILDVSSTTKGMLVPRMTSAERSVIVAPAQGLLVYDTDSKTFWYYDAGWKEITGGGGGGFSLPYNGSGNDLNNLFSITNTSNMGASVAIKGKRTNEGSGFPLMGTAGVWGDNSNGAGILATSNSFVGTYSVSAQHHGVYGQSDQMGYAGIYGTNSNVSGIGVMGLIENDGAAMYGYANGDNGTAGLFRTTSFDHGDTTMIVSTNGFGILGSFATNNVANQNPVVDIAQAGNGMGLKLRLNKVASSGNAIDILSQTSGIGVYSKSENGIPGKFEITNTTNTYPGLMVSTTSLGTAMYVSSTNAGNNGPAIDIFHLGTGKGLNVFSAAGNAATFTVDGVSTNKTNLIVEQKGLGKGIYINQTNPSTINPAIDIVSQGTKGINAQVNNHNAIAIVGSTGGTANNAIGVKGVTAPNVQNGIGVLGQAGVNDSNGIGVKGIAGGDNDGGIGVYGETSNNTPMAIAVKGVGYSHNEDIGAVTGVNMTDGVGVLGESLGFDGIGVVGLVGNTGNHSVAAMFKNNYNNNDRSVVEIISNGKGNGILIDHSSLTSTAPLFRMRNSGQGQFLRFEDGLGSIKTTLEKSGNLTTQGTVTVKGNKGIVRNSGSEQLRIETVMAVWDPQVQIIIEPGFGGVMDDIVFNTPFTTVPTVFIAQAVETDLWQAANFSATIVDVTTTGCTMIIKNTSNFNIDTGYMSWKLVVMGTE